MGHDQLNIHNAPELLKELARRIGRRPQLAHSEELFIFQCPHRIDS